VQTSFRPPQFARTCAHEVDSSRSGDAGHRSDAGQHIMHTVREETVVVTERVASRLPAIKSKQQQSASRLNLSIQSPDSFLSLGLARLGKIDS
jgi:hypothetical protein